MQHSGVPALLKNSTKMTSDNLHDKLIKDLLSRREAGLKKYGTTLQDAPLSANEVIQHLKEELLDAVVYIQKLQQIAETLAHFYEHTEYRCTQIKQGYFLAEIVKNGETVNEKKFKLKPDALKWLEEQKGGQNVKI